MVGSLRGADDAHNPVKTSCRSVRIVSNSASLAVPFTIAALNGRRRNAAIRCVQHARCASQLEVSSVRSAAMGQPRLQRQHHAHRWLEPAWCRLGPDHGRGDQRLWEFFVEVAGARAGVFVANRGAPSSSRRAPTESARTTSITFQ